MVGDDSVRCGVGGFAFAARFADGVADRLHQRGEQINFKVACNALHHRADSFQAHSGVHARRGQRREVAVVAAVELHKNQIPNLHAFVGVFFVFAAECFGVFVDVVKNFRARPARSGVAHHPEVVGSRYARDSFLRFRFGKARAGERLHPECCRVFVGGDRFAVAEQIAAAENRHPQMFLLQTQMLRRSQKLPRHRNGAFFEVVAERKVAEHFKESVMARGVPDIFQIVVFAAGAQAALRGARGFVIAPFKAEKDILELRHSRIGKKQSRVFRRNQRRGLHARVPALFKEGEKLFAYAGAFHGVYFNNKSRARAKAMANISAATAQLTARQTAARASQGDILRAP